MNKSLDIAKEKMAAGEYTCVVLAENDEYTSHERGVKPLLSLLESGRSFRGAVAADKCVGAGAAHLYVLLGVCAVWANIISISAIEILEKNGISVRFGNSVPHIINRRGDGICPIEEAVSGAKTSAQAYDLIIKTLKKLEEKAR